MKKLFFSFAVLAIAVLGFTSCDTVGTTDDTDSAPEIAVTSLLEDTISVEAGDTISFTVDVASENSLVSFQAMSSDAGVTFVSDIPDSLTGLKTATIEVVASVGKDVAANTDITITFVVTDEKLTSNAKKVINVTKSVNPLSAATAFEWKRIGGKDATGLDKFGLSWTSNTSTSAVIKKGADKFVELDAALWDSLKTVEELAAAIDAAANIDKWEGVSVEKPSATYNYLLGTIKTGTYYMIHVTNSSVAVTSEGSTVTISGESKDTDEASDKGL